ncbi:U6 snRNA phosphodiesterase-like isoform X1 [Mangifera indica]|uniref:U6 snRNA phosphodiesterase-like isoform X1 n=1 Tax=Mangifera indica TaxID=29780 RepID=UPI001CF95B40|nr:U6 snRNA phosphodiesterase-like isoform X1 [Mangifera indica]
MEALIASYGDTSSDSDSELSSSTTITSTGATNSNVQPETTSLPLPPPPLSLLTPPNSLGTVDYLTSSQPQPSRLRSFPHVEGNYALHVYIPVTVPSASKKELAQLLKKVSSIVPGLHAVDIDIPLSSLCEDDSKFQLVTLGRQFHISLGRTVPIRVHQIDSIVAMLRQKLQCQRRFWIDFSQWEVFINDDCTRSFLSIEVLTGGLLEITKQIQVVNEVYRLHNLPEFYKSPRPHISLAWALGDISNSLKRVIEEETKKLRVEGSLQKRIFSSKFSGTECKIGSKIYKICKFSDN